MTGENIDLPLLTSPRERQRQARIAALSKLIRIGAWHEDSFACSGDLTHDGMWLPGGVNDDDCSIAFEDEMDSAALMSVVVLRPNKTGGRGRLATAIRRNSDRPFRTGRFGVPSPEWM